MNEPQYELQIIGGHAFLGACWGTLYWILSPQTSYVYSLRSLAFSGLLMGVIFGFISLLVLFLMADNVRVLTVYTMVMFVIYVLTFTYLSLSSAQYTLNVLGATFASWAVMQRTLRMRRKEKLKNG